MFCVSSVVFSKRPPPSYLFNRADKCRINGSLSPFRARSLGVDNFRANHVSSFEAATEAEKEGSGQSTAFESVVNGEKAGGRVQIH